MAKPKNTPQTLDLASLSQEELLALATELQASNEALTAEKTELETKVTELKAAITKVDPYVSELESAKTELETKVSELEALITELSTANTVKVKQNQVSHAGEVYQLVTPKFWLGGKLINQETLEADEALVLLAIEAGNLKKIVTETEGEQ